MRKNKKGYYVQYTNKDGSVQKAAVYYDEQVPAFSDFKKVFLRLVCDDLEPKLNGDGKRVISVKNISELKRIGYFD